MLDTTSFDSMNEEQKKQVRMQWERHQHDDFKTDFAITPFGETLTGFIVKKGVWNPTIVSARHHAAYLFYHNGLFYGKDVIDIGCGTGLMGMVMGLYGARKVIMGDISPHAVLNTQENITHFHLENIAYVVVSNLFEKITGKADCITFMQPYFVGTPPKDDTISGSMIAPPSLLRSFLLQATSFLNPGGVIIMPSYSLAGELNDPSIVAREHGYSVTTTFLTESVSGIQKGVIAMHELRL